MEAWRGYHSSVRPTGLGLTLNLDVTTTTVLKPILVEEFLKERYNVRDLQQLQQRDWTKAKSVLKGVRVETTHMQVSRTHKISGFSDRPIRDLKYVPFFTYFAVCYFLFFNYLTLSLLLLFQVYEEG